MNWKKPATLVSALDRLNETEFDAVFLDVNLPDANGYAVLQDLRAARPQKWPLVFMYSSSDDPGDIQRAYDAKATAYLCKQKEFSKIKDLVTYCAQLIAGMSSEQPGFTTLH